MNERKAVVTFLMTLILAAGVWAFGAPAEASMRRADDCQFGVSEDDAWCCKCDNEECDKTYIRGITECDGPGDCDHITCTVGATK